MIDMRYRKWIAPAVVVAVVIVAIWTVYLMQNEEKQPEKKPYVRFDRIYGVIDRETNSGENLTHLVITFDIYITNIGDASSGDIELKLYAIDTVSGLAHDRGTATMAPLEKEKTSMTTISVTLSVGYSYRVEILLLEGDMLKDTAIVQVSLKEYGAYKVNPYSSSESGAEYDSIAGGVKESIGGNSGLFLASFFAIVLIIVLIIAAASQSRRDKKKREGNNYYRQQFYTNESDGNNTEEEKDGR